MMSPTTLPVRHFQHRGLFPFLWVLVFSAATLFCHAAEWQWSIPVGEGRAFLWIPPDCERVRAVVVGQNNMLEEGVLEHPIMRRELAKLGIAQVWVAPPFDPVFRFDRGAGGRFNAMLHALAECSGYSELARAPIIPIGHSACASYPWNFAAWDPARTLAAISLKGDSPLTNMTGSGQPNPDWGDRRIDGVPGLFVMSEYEWLEGRLQPAADFVAKFPAAPIAVLAEPGRGHFDCADELVSFLALFIRKAADQRLPISSSTNHTPALAPIDPAQGWLVERWKLDQTRKAPPAPAAHFSGDSKNAFWCFDAEMALATQNHFASQIGKKPQLLGYVQNGRTIPQTDTHNQVSLRLEPLADGITFQLGAAFLTSVEPGSSNLVRWTQQPVGTPLTHAVDGAIRLSRITGPVEQIDAGTFRIRLNRTASTTDRRQNDIWLLAEHAGDSVHKSAVQQALMKLTRNEHGREQVIEFPTIGDQSRKTRAVPLAATSDAGLPVSYYVLAGPAEIDGDRLRLTAVPPRAKFPIEITVVAWQWGVGGTSPVKTATPVTQTFHLLPD
jgi:hypothetical protein